MIVLDASALIDVVAHQPHRGWVLDQVEGATVLAPAHQPAEVLSAVARLERAGLLDASAAAEALEVAAELPQEVVAPSSEMIGRAFELRGRIRVLDGIYVALAEEREAPLVTTDIRLLRAEPPCSILAPGLP